MWSDLHHLSIRELDATVSCFIKDYPQLMSSVDSQQTSGFIKKSLEEMENYLRKECHRNECQFFSDYPNQNFPSDEQSPRKFTPPYEVCWKCRENWTTEARAPFKYNVFSRSRSLGKRNFWNQQQCYSLDNCPFLCLEMLWSSRTAETSSSQTGSLSFRRGSGGPICPIPLWQQWNRPRCHNEHD